MDSRFLKLLYTLLGAAIIYYIFPYSVPFLLALALAVIFEPPVDYITRRLKVRRIIAVNINFVIVLLICLGILFLGSTIIISEIMALNEQLPGFLTELGKNTQNFVSQARLMYENLPPEALTSAETTIRKLVESGNTLIGSSARALLGTATAIPNLLIVLLVMLVSFYLFSLQLPELKVQFLRLFTERAGEKVTIIITDINRAIIGFVRAHLIISGLTYIVSLAGLLILGVKYALALALLIVVVDILPVLGTGSVMLPWSIFLFILNKNFMAAGLLVLYLVIISFRRVVEPKILGQNIGLSPLTTVVSMYLGFKFLGAAGIAAGPAICVIFKAMRKAGMFQQKIDF